LVNNVPVNALKERVDVYMEEGAGVGAGTPIDRKITHLALQLADQPFFGGASVAYADFTVWHYLDNVDTLVPHAIDGHANLVAWMRRVAELAGVKEYLAKREQRGSKNLGFSETGLIRQDPSHTKPWGTN